MTDENKAGMVTKEMLTNQKSFICSKLFELEEYEDKLEGRAAAARELRQAIVNKLEEKDISEEALGYIFEQFYNTNFPVGLTYEEIMGIIDNF